MNAKKPEDTLEDSSVTPVPPLHGQFTAEDRMRGQDRQTSSQDKNGKDISSSHVTEGEHLTSQKQVMAEKEVPVRQTQRAWEVSGHSQFSTQFLSNPPLLLTR